MGSDRLMPATEGATFAERFVAMGTRIELHLFGAPDAGAAAMALRAAIEAIDDALTIHGISPTTRLNDGLRGAGHGTVDDPLLWGAILLCDALHTATGGLFDPTAGMGEARWHDIEIDPIHKRLRSPRPTALDFGGIGKGIALDHCVPILTEAGVPSALLSLGESSILAHGEHPLGGAWPLVVQDPRDHGEALVELSLNQRCVSISSTVGQANGDTLASIDGTPIRAPITAVSVDPSGATAEAFSTALIVAGPARRKALRDCEALHVFDLSSDHCPSAKRASGDCSYA
jgi:thiamine biosynthesis lipoprotein ApbE